MEYNEQSRNLGINNENHETRTFKTYETQVVTILSS